MSTDNIIKFCPFCGSRIIPDAKFCVQCGKNLKLVNIASTDNNPENTTETDEKTVEVIPPEKSEPDNYSERISENNHETPDNLDKNINTPSEEQPMVKKSFSLLNKKRDNNFDLIRPNTTTLPKRETEKINTENPQYPEKIEDTPIVEYNSDGLSCPLCGNNMHLSQTSGILSKATYHECPKCSLKFKESNSSLVLVEEPPLSRMNSKLHLKKYDLNQWREILSGELTPEFKDEYNKWKFDSPPLLSCPACNHDFARYKSSGFGSKYYLICSGCSLTLEEQNNNLYTLHDCIENYSPLWKYEKNPLTLEQMKEIITNEESEENRLFREKKVKETEQKIREYEMKVKQEQNDLALFNQRLESGNPVLPAPSDTTIVLKKNEVPVYKIDNVTLSEPRAVRTSSGGYGGTSVRIAKGVTIHSGRTASKSESHDEIKVIDSGELLITNQRVIFLGQNRTTNIDMKKIISITSGPSMIQIQRSNKQKPEYFDNVTSTIDFQVEDRHYDILVDGEMIKKLIMGLI